MPLLQSRYLPLLALVLLLAASAGLYIPWIDNPLVFDDPNLLKSPSLGDFAVMPFSLQPRQFPYFTLGFEQVISNGNLHVSRYVALILHGLNGFLLFLLGRRLLGRATTDANKATFLAFAAGLLFVVHPVSVYATGYLIQRTILFATFFLLLSAIQFDKALTEGSWRRAAFAGLCYGMAAMSKEHAIAGFISIALLPMVKSGLSPLNRRVVMTYVGTCLPVMLWIISIKASLIGTLYEPYSTDIIDSPDFPNTGTHLGNWLLSAAFQCHFFFSYLGYWLWPNPLSIDIRPDFSSIAQLPSLAFFPLLITTLGLASFFTLASNPHWPSAKTRLIAWGVVGYLCLYVVEFSSIRFQEPVVLYRSYLWFPFILVGLTSCCAFLSTRLALPLISLTLVGAIYMSEKNLNSFSDEIRLWEMAARLLPNINTPGRERIYYNIGFAELKRKQFDTAEEWFQKIIDTSPRNPWGYWGLALVKKNKADLCSAIRNTRLFLERNPNSPKGYLFLGFTLLETGAEAEGQEMLSHAKLLGMPQHMLDVSKMIRPQKNKGPYTGPCS